MKHSLIAAIAFLIAANTAHAAVIGTDFGNGGDGVLDPVTGVLHEVSTVRNETGEERPFDLWTTCFTARELDLVARGAGVDVGGVFGVAPGNYGDARPDLDRPELLLVGRRRV